MRAAAAMDWGPTGSHSVHNDAPALGQYNDHAHRMYQSSAGQPGSFKAISNTRDLSVGTVGLDYVSDPGHPTNNQAHAGYAGSTYSDAYTGIAAHGAAAQGGLYVTNQNMYDSYGEARHGRSPMRPL